MGRMFLKMKNTKSNLWQAFGVGGGRGGGGGRAGDGGGLAVVRSDDVDPTSDCE